MAGNPFRRPPSDRPEDDTIPARSSISTSGKPRTIKKKVKIQTPPRSPEEPPRRLSAGNISPPPPSIDDSPDESDTSDSTATADSELEEASRNTRRNSGSLAPSQSSLPAPTIKAPYNPFARTLATTEAAYGLQGSDEGAKKLHEDKDVRPNAGRPAMNVEQFKNILLGAAPAPSPPPTSSSPAMQASGAVGMDSARQTFFDPQYDIDTPRASFDDIDDLESASSDDGEHSSLMSGSERLDDFAPPAPPKQSSGGSTTARGPQTVSFDDFDHSFSPAASATQPHLAHDSKEIDNKLRPPPLRRQPSDLNKPLPKPPPQSPPANSSRFGSPDKAVSEQPSDDTEESRRAPPPPPTARRTRSSSNPMQEVSQADASATTPKPPGTTVKPSPPPPPPRSRKARAPPAAQDTGNEIGPVDPPAETAATDSKAMPPPPPPRNSTKQPATLAREPSDSSILSTSRLDSPSSSTISQGQNAPPMPPPPRRAGGSSNRTSVDGPPTSLKDGRRSSAQSVDTQRSNSLQNLTGIQESAGEAALPSASAPPEVPRRDVLADMSAFQAEIDALRAKSVTG